MKHNLYWLLAILCVTHAVLVSVAFFTSSVRVLFPTVATAVWFVWPVIIWRVGAKKWRLALPLLLGFAALLPIAAVCPIWFPMALIGFPSSIKEITAKRIIGHGDVGQFILQTAEEFGATPTVTNGLPHISDQWSYFKENDRVVIHVSNQTFPAVVDFLHQSLGQPTGSGDSDRYYQYYLTTKEAISGNGVYIGAVLYVHELDKDTEVVIQSHPEPSFSIMLPNNYIIGRIASFRN